jgi:hypothetical protein
MSLQEFGSVSWSRLAASSTGVALGALMLMSGAANAASPAGDVVVPTESGSGGVGVPTGGSTATPPLNTIRFACQMSGGASTVMYMPESQPNQAYAWAVPSNMGGGWSSDARCTEISRRLEAYRPDGLIEMKTAVENGYNTICVTTEQVPSCRIVLTVPQGQDPVALRDRVFQNLTIADSGQQTQGVAAYTDGGKNSNLLGQLGQVLGIGGKAPSAKPSSGNIDLRPFLDRKDGGTGDRLTGGVTVRPAAIAPQPVVQPAKVTPTPPAAQPAPTSGKKFKRGLFRR